MKFNFKKITFFFLITILMCSCVARKKIVYFTDIDSKQPNRLLSFEPVLETNDLLSITVTAKNPELTVPFNLQSLQNENPLNTLKTYLIDAAGFIDFPVLGKVKIGGLTKTAANKILVDGISEYIKEPTVNLNIVNFKVTMLGDINKPGTLLVPSERITILEAISQSGDLLLTGKRDNVLLIREINGKKSYNRIDLSTADFINSDFYYLKQNDLIYIEPNKTKVNGSRLGANTGIIVSIVTFIVSVSLAFIIKK